MAAEVTGEEMDCGDISSGDADIGIPVGLGRERGGVCILASALESRVMCESTDETEVCLVLKPDRCGRDGPLEEELVGVEGRTKRPISRGLVDRASP
jgi:hypothetical protein